MDPVEGTIGGEDLAAPLDAAARLKDRQAFIGSGPVVRGDDVTHVTSDPVLGWGTEDACQVSGLNPQLLNSIDDCEVGRIVNDATWLMQEKFDGRRLMLRKTGDTVEGINKLGLVIAVAEPVVEAALSLAGNLILDGEAVAEHFHVFDVLSRSGTDLRDQPYAGRYGTLIDLLGSGQPDRIHCAVSWVEPAEKANQLAALRAQNAEGVVFKRLDAPYTPGRPNSGGSQLKIKFVATVSALVVKVNAQRSVAVARLDDG